MTGKKVGTVTKKNKIEECMGESLKIIPELTQQELMDNNPTLLPPSITPEEKQDKAEDVLKVIEQIRQGREGGGQTEETRKTSFQSLETLRSKYESHCRLFSEYKFQSLNLSWNEEELTKRIEKMRHKVLNSDGMEHLDIHTNILKGSSGVLENVITHTITDVKGLSGRLMANKNIGNSSKLLLGELIDFISPPSNSSAIKTLLTQVVVELMKTILTNNLSKSVVNRISQLETLLEDDVEVKKHVQAEDKAEVIVDAVEH